MRLEKWALVLSLSFVSFTAAAEPQNVQVLDAPNSETVYRDTSAFYRLDKKFSVNYLALGVGPSRGTTSGIIASFFIDHNSLIDLEFLNGKAYDWDLTFSKYEIQTRSFGLHYKRFFGNSFYVRGGLDYRTVDYNYTFNDIFNPNTIFERNSFKGTSLSATILIGNQWQWDYFTLGCDWIGFSQPFSHQVDSESATGSSPDPIYLKSEENYFLKSSVTMALRFYLGISF